MRATAADRAASPVNAYLICAVAWALPGVGHLWQGRIQKGLVFLVTLPLMFGFEAGQSAQPLVAILFQDGAPQSRVASRDARGVAQAAPGVVAPSRVFLREEGAKARGEHLRKMADVGDDLVVLVRGDGHGLGAEVGPEARHRGRGRGHHPSVHGAPGAW